MASKDKVFYSKNTLNVNGNLIDLSSPKIMGILNITDDSFYDGGRFKTVIQLSKQTEKLIDEGADFIDIGGYSSRPGADNISVEIERERISRGIRSIQEVSSDIIISVDTFRSEIAKEALDAGAGIINDISGGNLDKDMFHTISEFQVPYILMHMKGTPQNMVDKAKYEHLIIDLLDFFSKKLSELAQFGIKDVIIDVGFGFAKTILQNYHLLKKLEVFKVLNAPVLVGISRKSMIYKILESTPMDALNGTTTLNTIALMKNVNILRVHDVKEAKEVMSLVNHIQN